MRGRAGRGIVSAAAAGLLLGLCASAGAAPAATEWALLVRGSLPVKGIPGFGANAIPALYGEYRVASLSEPVAVWATREGLYLDPRIWKGRRAGGLAAYERASSEEDAFPVLRTLIAAESAADWTVVVAFPGDAERNAEIDRFMRRFVDRFNRFALSAKLPSDVSFPAVLDER